MEKKQDIKNKGGRPSSYKDDYARQAYELALLGLTDEEMARVFGIALAEFAEWAFENEAFFNAITPTEDDIKRRADELRTKRLARAERRRKGILSNPSLRIRNSISARMWSALKGKTDGALFSRLGYSPEDLVTHLSSLFDDGMSWENYGKWHVDHIKPCASFDLTDKDQFDACWRLSNLQPLWASENIRKGAKYGGS